MDGQVLGDMNTGGVDAALPQADVGQSESDMGPAEPVVVALDDSGDYLDLQSALAAEETRIMVMPGEYVVDEAIVFVTPGTQVEGSDAETVRFVQTNNEQDLFVVRADDVTISSVSLDTSTAGQAAFVEQAANRVVLQDSIISGGDQILRSSSRPGGRGWPSNHRCLRIAEPFTGESFTEERHQYDLRG